MSCTLASRIPSVHVVACLLVPFVEGVRRFVCALCLSPFLWPSNLIFVGAVWLYTSAVVQRVLVS